MTGIEGHWFSGWVEGDLYEHGWGATEGYPAMLFREGAAPTAGQIYAARLDETHGE